MEVNHTETAHKKHRGRGTSLNPQNRFESIDSQIELSEITCDDPDRKTRYYIDKSKSALSFNQSPDIPFEASLNPYRGCEHGCVYCYARPSHEYLGFSSGLDFESRILVKKDAPALLRKALAAKSWKPKLVAMGANTDPYQPIEKQLQITRQSLEVFLEFQNPVGIVTKNNLVLRDTDLLKKLASKNLVSVFVSVTSLDSKFSRQLEPRASQPRQRLDTIEALKDAGVPVGVMIAPVIPALNEYEIPAILEQVANVGAGSASYILLRLPYAIKDLFSDWLQEHYPDRKQKVLNRLLDLRGGKLYNADFKQRMRGQGEYAEQIAKMFKVMSRKFNLDKSLPALSTSEFIRKDERQLGLF
ncbi:MAG: PA0069 family radical SAM protein [Deltaproteobacteria bacterium]|nr:PA0069 family radical SAM protein [Deltaproteobacteria bacterium]